MEHMYINWNAGLTKDGKHKTYDYIFDRKVTVAYAEVEKVIDDNLCKGSVDEIDDLYVNVLNGSCRHITHSGVNGHPSKKDRCAVAEKVIDRKKNKRSASKFEYNQRLKNKNTKVCKVQNYQQMYP